MSIRRGDFLDPKYKKLHYVCDEKYFEKAITIIKTKVKNPVFIFFSDDIEWVKTNIKTYGIICYYESGKDEVFEKLRLMSMCKHFIISNSTFSWWAQYLCKNPYKIVISPRKWLNNNEESGLIDESWIKI